MITIYRHRAMKPRDGKIEFVLHRDATVIAFTEHWHRDNGWEVIIDALQDTELPVERRRFFLCTGGDRLDPLGENAFAYHVGTHEAKAYCSFLFDVSHLPDQIINQLEADWGRLQRKPPAKDEMSFKAKQAVEREGRKKTRHEEIKERKDRQAAEARELAERSAATNQLVESRQASDQERERIEAEQLVEEIHHVGSLRVVEGGG